VISYYDLTIGALKIAHCENILCSRATISSLSDGRTDIGKKTNIKQTNTKNKTNINKKILGKMSSIAIGQDGFPIIASFDSTNKALWFSKCANLICSFANSQFLTPPSSNAGWWPSISILNGKPIVSFIDFASQRLFVSFCSDLNCAAYSNIGPLDNTASMNKQLK